MTYNIDWSKIDEQYNWVAVDVDGAVYAYTNKPEFLPHSGEWFQPTNAACWISAFACGGSDYLYERPKGHKHAKLMLEFARDALVNEKPWKLWEYSADGVSWKAFEFSPPSWDGHFYRRKPRFTSIEIPAKHKETVEAFIKALEQA